MIDAFAEALAGALSSMLTAAGDALGDLLPIVIGVQLGLMGVFLVWRVVVAFADHRPRRERYIGPD